MSAPDRIRTFEQLTEAQAAAAWAVVRSIATALWSGLAAAVIGWVFLAARVGESPPRTALALLVGAAALAGVMEVKARDLENLPQEPDTPGGSDN